MPRKRTEAPDAHLWKAYHKTRSDQDRNVILEFHWPWIIGKVRLYLALKGMEYHADDVLGNVALRVLRSAIPNFDLKRNVRFRTYLYPHLTGAIADWMRSQDVPRSVRHKIRAVSACRERLAHAHGYMPTDADLAKATGLSESKIVMVTGVASQAEVALSDPGDELGVLDCPPRERVDVINYLCRGLKRGTRRVILLYYLHGLTMSEIGKKTSVSESRISQILTYARKFLRENRSPSELHDRY